MRGFSVRQRPVVPLLVALVATLAAGTLSSRPAEAAACAELSLATVQPVDGNVLKVARLAGAKAGQPDVWDMRYDAWFCNPGVADLFVTQVKIEHRTNGQTTKTVTLTPSTNTIDGETDARLIQVRDQAQYVFPLPQAIRITFTVRDGGGNLIDTFERTHSVAVHQNAGPLKGYFFPARDAENASNEYWMQGRHAEPNFQRWAYDLVVQRWTGSAWIGLRAGAPEGTTDMNDGLTFGRKLYAMSDGEIIGCNRGAPDNNSDENVGNVPGGNLLWVRTGDETTLYAHLQQDSIPLALCPFSDDAEHKLADPDQDLPGDAAYQIKAGQFLGRAGNSGFSRGGHSHLHIHVFRGLPAIWGGSETGMDSDSRPLHFVNVRVQPKTGANVNSADWNVLGSPKQLPYQTRLEPNWCSENPSAYAGKAEVVRLNISRGCFGDMFNAMVQAGFRPTSLDFFTVGVGTRSNSVWRPNDGTPWVLLHGMSNTALQNAHDKWVKKEGFRYLTLESYRLSGKLRHAVILVKQPGVGQYARAGLSTSGYQDVFDTQKQQGRRPMSVSVAVVGGQRRYSAVFVKANVGSFVAKAHVSTAAYQAEFDAQSKAGRKLMYVDGYRYNGTPYLSAVWWAKSAKPAARHGATRLQIAQTSADQLAAGRYTRRITGYQQGGVRFAGLWRARPSTTITAGPSGTTSTTTATFKFTSGDPLARFECLLGRLGFGACASPVKLTGLQPALHTFSVRARDLEGLRDLTPASRAWTVSGVTPR
ncbi:MAG TPA: hypothetical protein VLI04_07540 [Nocardioidaceae bacterium]|nr:hypothetical protein [Nocardioidaceae bacterium]